MCQQHGAGPPGTSTGLDAATSTERRRGAGGATRGRCRHTSLTQGLEVIVRCTLTLPPPRVPLPPSHRRRLNHHGSERLGGSELLGGREGPEKGWEWGSGENQSRVWELHRVPVPRSSL